MWFDDRFQRCSKDVFLKACEIAACDVHAEYSVEVARKRAGGIQRDLFACVERCKVGVVVFFQQMGIFFIIVVVGWIVRRADIITRENQPQLSALVANVCGPCMCVTSAISATERVSLGELGYIYVVFIILTAAMLLFGFVLPILLRFEGSERGVVNMMTWLTNIGFLGLPVATSVYGANVAVYIALFMIPNTIVVYTYGIWCIGAANSEIKFTPKKLINPGMVGALATIIIYLTSIEVPYVIAQPVTLIGNMTSPLAMMVVGASLADVNLKRMFANLRLYGFTVLSMIVMPIVVVLGLKLFVANANLLAVCMLILATPSGVMTSIFANMYNPKAYLLASEGIAMTTLASLVTMPLVALAVGL